MALSVDIDMRDRTWPGLVPGPEALVRDTLAEAGAAVGVEAGEVSVVLADDDFVRMLNQAHRGMDAPTNVLSFPTGGGAGAAGADPLLGDIVLASGTVAREARLQGKAPADHVAHLTVHGFLHLLGYDHQADGEAREMEALEASILARLGIPDPYAEAESDEAEPDPIVGAGAG